MRFDDLQGRVPLLGDAALVDLSSGLQVVGDHVVYRSRRTFFQRVFDSLVGKEAQRQNQIDQNLVENQARLFQYADALLDRQKEGDLALALTQQKLVETRRYIRRMSVELRAQASGLERLEAEFALFERKVDERLGGLEMAVQKLNAIDILTDIVESWGGGGTYRNLPMILQLDFVTREVLNRVWRAVEHDEGMLQDVRRRFINKSALILRRGSEYLTIQDLLRDLVGELSAPDLEMSLALVDPRMMQPGLSATPLRFCMGTFLELQQTGLRSVAENVDLAIELTELNGMDVQRVYSPQGLLEFVFDENWRGVASQLQSIRLMEAA